MNARAHRFRIGAFAATIVSDGPLTLHAPGRVLMDAPEDRLATALTAAGQATDLLRVAQNVLVLDTGTDRLLFDTGMGSATLFGTESGRLLPNLRAAGIAPESVTGVVLTHAHSDHAWGVSSDAGVPHFPNARIYLADTEYAYWTSPDMPGANRSAIGFRRHLLPLRERLVLLRDGQDVVTGVRAMHTPGHTPGHTSYLIDNGGASYLLLGDAAFHAPLSLIFPQSRSLYDVDPLQAIATRTRVIAQVAAERRAIIAYHYPWPGTGRIEAAGDAHHFVPD